MRSVHSSTAVLIIFLLPCSPSSLPPSSFSSLPPLSLSPHPLLSLLPPPSLPSCSSPFPYWCSQTKTLRALIAHTMNDALVSLGIMIELNVWLCWMRACNQCLPPHFSSESPLPPRYYPLPTKSPRLLETSSLAPSLEVDQRETSTSFSMPSRLKDTSVLTSLSSVSGEEGCHACPNCQSPPAFL